jgi:D-sedoheptulose 7-phosphate isomerase
MSPVELPGLVARRVDELLARRTEANARFFAAEADRIAHVCADLADRFLRDGRLLALGSSPQAWSDARHVAVEFVHPVIVGKRALPALALSVEEAAALARPEDMTIAFEPLRIVAAEEWTFEPPTDDPFVSQELVETLYHVVWELVHVFFEHRGSSAAGAGASGFLYPFLGEGSATRADVVADVARSVRMKAEEVAELRAQTLREGGDALAAAAEAVGRALGGGGTLLAFGNGGSATDAADAVADFRAAPQGWPRRRALDLSEDSGILTALANDIGPSVLFQRQVIAYGREGDVALAISTSGSSANIVAALREARARDLATVALVGYGGGLVVAERLADHVIVSRSEHIPRIQEAQASAYHVLRELVEIAGAA